MVVDRMPAWTVLYVELFPALCAMLVLAAWRWGGSNELIVASLYVIATDLQKCLQGVDAPMFHHIEYGVAAIDFGVLSALTALAVTEPRKWILCSAALQMLVTSSHFAKYLESDISPLSYAILAGSGGYPMLALLAFGTALAAWENRQAA